MKEEEEVRGEKSPIPGERGKWGEGAATAAGILLSGKPPRKKKNLRPVVGPSRPGAHRRRYPGPPVGAPRLGYPPAPGQARPRARGLTCGTSPPAKPAPDFPPCTYPAPGNLGAASAVPASHAHPHRLPTRYLPCTAHPPLAPWPAQRAPAAYPAPTLHLALPSCPIGGPGGTPPSCPPRAYPAPAHLPAPEAGRLALPHRRLTLHRPGGRGLQRRGSHAAAGLSNLLRASTLGVPASRQKGTRPCPTGTGPPTLHPVPLVRFAGPPRARPTARFFSLALSLTPRKARLEGELSLGNLGEGGFTLSRS